MRQEGQRSRFGRVLVFLSFLFFVPLLTAQEEAELERINRLIERTKQQLSTMKKQESSVLSALLTAQQELDQIELELERLDQRLRLVQREITKLEREQAQVEQELARLNRLQRERADQYNRRLVAVYKYGPLSYLELLVAAENFADLISKFEMVSYFLRADARLIAEVTAIKEEISAHQRTLQGKRRELDQQRAAVISLEKAAAEQQKLKAALVKKAEEELNKIQQDRKRLEAALDELEETSRQIEAEIKRRQQKEAMGTGKLIWPLPVKGRISSPFGERMHPILKQKRFHSGIDIAVPTGTDVLAADRGRVMISGWNGGYGYFIVIDHGNGLATAYAHNSRLLVKEGDVVAQGQVIAKSGSTGLSTGPHLHFEVRKEGAPVDPAGYLPK
ncbi:murein hydrolase activator EnvC family protein [Capillibacterium thermochitinicola]|uniref:Peptidoglycan DD-metalloendopeptidase family protein n=1 Tax=Capillibacterium thermochitinicola TaxID=2699427 RepID=A0A8J6LMT1_9FIRM|nr:M23 family metallopeptidase [Capillibacterium thermochitinicola]MBA2133158.1 peptidoglycan DD-metalloendopeptidase family protein [Capillibacterium thermochitinicola]